ncbi:MAG: hypothetical protein KDB94_10555 [Acidobacteria bacterium]|nr:hypothetical protein [Acidobacteriota bacterium]
MRHPLVPTVVVAALLASCGGGQEPPSQKQVDKEVKETLRRAQTGEKVTETESGRNPCDMLRAVDLAATFDVEASAIEFRPSFTSHPLCTATWNLPNAAELQAKQGEVMMDYMKRKAAAQSKREPFDEKIPILRTDASASLTVVNQEFDSPEEAVAFLENAVATLGKGITTEVMGKKHTTQIAYDDWMSGVGDRAAWAPKLSELSVAADGVVFHVSVRASQDAAENQNRAIEIAKKIAAGL